MPKGPEVPKKLLERIQSITNKRARVVLDTILQNGSISTAELKTIGYDHPPRAKRDAVELGIAIKCVMVKGSNGKRMGMYVFDERELDPNKTGRVVVPKKEREALIKSKGAKCNLCGATHNLQVDHRIPYEVAGESQFDGDDPYQVLDGSCNRTKSWVCEHCENWRRRKDFDVCRACYWANPEDYSHIAMRPERRIDIVWAGDEVKQFVSLATTAKRAGRTVAEEIKTRLR
jgi:hypothetical protein